MSLKIIHGTTSVAGEINVGKNFEATAGKNTYNNKTDSSSSSANVGYDAIGKTVTGGVSGNKGNSNSSSVSYDNTVINVGGGFHLNTKEDATFKGANVKADKIEFEIGGGVNYGHNDTSNGGYNSPVGNVNYGESKGVNNQTSIIAENGGNINVGETLTNIGSIIGSKNDTMNIEAKELVTENLKDHDNGKDYNVGLGGIDSKNAVPQTDLQYSSHDKEQDTNATFVNTVVKENGKEVDLEERGINTDINNAQVVTKDDVVEQIDTMLHTDLANKEKRKDLIEDMNLIADNTVVIGTSIGTKLNNNKNGSSNPEIWELENQKLDNITKAVEVAVKNKDKLSVTESERNDYDKLADKFKDYRVSEIIVVSNDTVFRDSNGNIVEGAHAGFDKDTGVIYITENVAKKPLGDFNKILGEEVGELYAHKTGLGVDNGTGSIVAEQIGQIFGNQMSKGKDNNSIFTGNINVNNSLNDVKIDGADKLSAGLTKIFGTKMGEKEYQFIEKNLNALDVNKIRKAKNSAEEMTAKIFYEISDNFYQDEADAFRHAYWNALMAQNMGYKGLNFSYAHEGLDPGEPADRVYNGKELKDVQMDVHNNRIGYEIGRENPKATKDEIAVLVLEKLKSNSLKVINSKTYQKEKIDKVIKQLKGK